MAGNSKDSKILAYKDMINQLNKTISTQTELIQSLQKTLEADRLEKENLRQQIEYLTKKLFGTSSEKRKDIDGQLNLFDEAGQEADPTWEQELPDDITVPEHKRKARRTHAEELYDRVLCMEQIMSTGGGWQDQVGGLAPGIKMVSSEPAIRQRITCVPCKISEKTRKELDERFCLIYSGQRRLARNLLRDVVGRYVGGIEDAVDVLYAIQQTAVLMRFELEKGNIDGFAELLNQHWELSKKLDASCTNTCIDMIFHSVEDLIDGKMICGAGGGGFLQVVLKKGVTQEDVRKRLREVFQDSGVDVWSCSLA